MNFHHPQRNRDSNDNNKDLSTKEEEPSSSNGVVTDKQLNCYFDDDSDDSCDDDDKLYEVSTECSDTDSFSDDEEEGNQKETTSGWNSDPFNPEIVEFTGDPGFKVPIPSDNKLEWLELFLTPEIVEFVVEQTNRYAEQFFIYQLKETPLKAASPFNKRRRKEWKNVTKNEIYRFLGLHLLSGINRRPDIRMYWSKNELLTSDVFRKIMQRDRFLTILKFLNFCNNENIPKNNTKSLAEIKEVLKLFADRFKSVYIPNRQIAIDEAMLKWKGRLRFKVHMKFKPDKYGIKSYVLAESSSGYVWNFEIYSGEGKTINQTVFNLLDNLTNKGYFLFMDNYYNSVYLSQQLLSEGTYVCGTLRKRRGEPVEITEKAKVLKRGETFFMSNGKVCIHLWHQKRVVKMISTMHPLEMEKVKTKNYPDGVLKPVSVLDYNKYMGAVDKCNQMVKYYPCFRKTLKWQKKIFFYFLNICCSNALALYRKQFPKEQLTLFDFIYSIIKEMLMKRDDTDYTNKYTIQRLSGGIADHSLISNPPGKKGHARMRRCVVCSKHKICRRSAYSCKECNVTLCKTPCFKNYHTKKHY